MHTRPVQCLVLKPGSANTHEATLYTADTLGVINIWKIEVETSGSDRVARITQTGNVEGHRTGISDMWYTGSFLWTGESGVYYPSSHV